MLATLLALTALLPTQVENTNTEAPKSEVRQSIDELLSIDRTTKQKELTEIIKKLNRVVPRYL